MTRSRLEVREAILADAAGMVAVLNPIIAAGIYSAMQTPLTLAAQIEYLELFPAEGVFSVAIEGERLVGLQSIEEPIDHPKRGKRGEISTFVALDRRGAGIGGALAERTLPLAKKQGYRGIVAQIRADNPAALAYYRAIGFQPPTPSSTSGDSTSVTLEHSLDDPPSPLGR